MTIQVIYCQTEQGTVTAKVIRNGLTSATLTAYSITEWAVLSSMLESGANAEGETVEFIADRLLTLDEASDLMIDAVNELLAAA